jgi:Ca2+ transporting ATPase
MENRKIDVVLVDVGRCGRNERLINPSMWKFMLGSGLIELVVLFILLYAGDKFLPLTDGLLTVEQKEASVEPSQHYTIIFNTFVWLQIFNEFNARKIDRGK